jgi:protein gp37
MQYASTYGPSYSAEASSLEDAAYEAGVKWAIAGHKAVPREIQVNGQWIHPLRGHGAAVDFRLGFKVWKENNGKR